MARIPNPPDLEGKQSFFSWLISWCVRFIFGWWLMCQAIGFIFWSIWNLSSHEFREFMFRGYIDVWYKHSPYVLPPWFFKIPTWKTPYIWVLLALFLVLRFWWSRRQRTRSEPIYKDRRQSEKSPYDEQNFQGDEDDESAYGFKSWKWKKRSSGRELDPQNKPKTQYENALDLFDLNDPFTMAELKKAYARLSLKTHPDTGGDAALFRRVHSTYEFLKAEIDKR